MNELISKAFEGNSIRIVTDERGEPWFVAVDVASALGYTDTDQAIRRHCKVVKTYPVETTGQVRHLSTVPERDVYRLIMRSKLESAERFEEWVVGEVLPSIRKNGGYIAGQEHDSPELIMAKALMVAQSVIDRKSQELEQAKRIIEEQEPAVEFSAQVGKNDKGVLLELFGKSVGIGRNNLFGILRTHKVLIPSGKSKNIPYQEYIDRGYFTTSESHYERNGEVRLSFTTLITGKGQQWLVGKLIEKGYLAAKSPSGELAKHEAKKLMEVV